VRLPTGSRPRPSRPCGTSPLLLGAAGSSMDHMIKTTIFYANVEDFGRLNELYPRHLPDPPADEIGPANVRLPRGLLVSIEAIAVLPTSPS
jgi:2-iminobutanoate/2-iminopropanoate deaminase